MKNYDLSKKTIEELKHLKKCIDYEIYKRNDEILSMKQEEMIFRTELQKYGYWLIKFIEEKLEYNIVTDSRKPIFTNSRFILMKHLREKGMRLNQIGKLFYRDHATVITCINKYNDLYHTKEPFFIEQLEKINELIEEYDKSEKNTETPESIQTKSYKVA